MTATFKPRYRIGFTGTRNGMTPQQIATVRDELEQQLRAHPDKELQAHHGDAIGADADFHRLCQELGIAIVIHQPFSDKERAFCTGAIDQRPRKDFGEQSESIVNATEILIATPDGMKERVRGSGTWMTVRKARKAYKAIVICFPDGSRKAESVC